MAEPLNDLRINWRANWLSAIQELADFDLQLATWLNPHQDNPHYTFVEFVECYFDDLVLRDDEGGYSARIAEGLLSDEEAAAASRLHSELDRYEPPTGDDYDHEAILTDPAWRRVVATAQEAQNSLARIILAPEEQTHLLQRSPFALSAMRT